MIFYKIYNLSIKATVISVLSRIVILVVLAILLNLAFPNGVGVIAAMVLTFIFGFPINSYTDKVAYDDVVVHLSTATFDKLMKTLKSYPDLVPLALSLRSDINQELIQTYVG